jgi:hypothetical protein
VAKNKDRWGGNQQTLQEQAPQIRAEPTGTGRNANEESPRDDMLEWLATQPGLLRAYQGEWVAFAGHDIVAHDPSFLKVMQQVDSLGVEDPLLVPVAPDQPFIG